jgi:uncharacterized protein (DUF952 family)
MTIYKIVPRRLWEDAMQTGAFDGSPVDIRDGFVHFSTAAQLGETAATHFRGATDLLLVAVDSDALGEALKWEPSRGGGLFPHLYGSLPAHRVLSVAPFDADAPIAAP